jgi:uncharacterized RDD family membrane protein YckC
LFADLLDSIVLGFLGYAIGYPFRYALSAMGLQALWVGLVCSFLYFGILHTRIGGGQTLGKRWLGIQVLKRDGSFLGLKSSLIRYLAISVIFYNGLFGSLFALLPTKLGMALGSVFLLGVVWAFFACYLLIPLHPSGAAFTTSPLAAWSSTRAAMTAPRLRRSRIPPRSSAPCGS